MNATITLLFDALIYGFCFTTFISYFLSLFKSVRLNKINNRFFKYSIKTIRIIAIVYFVYYIVDLTNYYFFKDHSLFTERATGTYWFAYWIMLLRPFLFCLLIQLLWIKQLQRKNVVNFLLVLIILFLVLASGANIERYIILLTSFHRDYAPDNFYLFNQETTLFQLIVIGIIERILFYATIVFIVSYASKKLNAKSL
ncbi:hypothetical protein [Lacinutrix chionoecetis]